MSRQQFPMKRWSLLAILLTASAVVTLITGCTPPPTGRQAAPNTTASATTLPQENSTNTTETPAEALPAPVETALAPIEEPVVDEPLEETAPAEEKAEPKPEMTKEPEPAKPEEAPAEEKAPVEEKEAKPEPTPAKEEMKKEEAPEEKPAPKPEPKEAKPPEAKPEATSEEKPKPEKEKPTEPAPGEPTPAEEMPAKEETSQADQPAAKVASAAKTTNAASKAIADSQDWLFWRGPEFNGISRATGLPDEWDPEGGEGSNVLWKRDDLGSRSTPVVMNGKLYILASAEEGTPREGERVICVDAATGETIWENRFNVYLSDVPVERVGWSAVTADPETNSVYALGVSGHFQCIDADTGKTKWMQKMHEQYGLLTTYGGRTNFPIIHEDLVIISGIVIGWGEMAKPAHRFLGLDKRTGEVVWFTQTTPLPYDTTYSAPTIKVVDGIPQYIIGAGDGKIWSMQPRTGQHNWSFSFAARGLYGTPLVDGDTVYMAQGEENIRASEVDGEVVVEVDATMGAVVAVDATKRGDISVTGQKWKVVELNGNRSTPLLVNGKLYVMDDRAKLFVLDPETGEELFKRTALGRKMFASPLYADGKIYTITESGYNYVLKIQDDGSLDVLSKNRLKDGSALGSPICAQGRLYFPTTAALYCVADPKKETGFSGLPKPPVEDSIAEDEKAAHVQVIPAEALIRPSEEIDYQVRLFNSKGQLLETTEDVEFSVEGPASMENGTLKINGDVNHKVVIVTAKSGDLTGQARVRVVPDLPWSFDFEDIAIDEATGKGEPYVTWVGARYRHIVREVDGNQVMVKITTIPKGTRSRSWMGHSDFHDYTIEADVQGNELSGQLPDIGLIAQGYSFSLMGNESKARLQTWVTQRRIAKDVDFDLEPGVWYQMKLQVANVGDKAEAKGKVWKKGEPEPEAWTIEVEDLVPNTTGSPGLFGNAKTGEVYYDNIKVTPNN